MKKVKDFLCREIAGEYILIPTGNTTEKFNGMITLTETAAFIYNHIEEAKTFEELIDMILKEYQVDRETSAIDAIIFINHLLQEGLIALSDKDNNW